MADLDQQTEEALGWAAEGKKLAVDIPEVSFKDAATFVASATPIIGDAMAAKEVYDELQKDEPNYYLAGALGGAALVGLVPGLGDAAAKAIKKGATEVFDVAKRVEVDLNTMGSGLGNVKLKPKEPFKKTRSAYRIATQSEDGKLYPLFVNASDEIPVNEWISASVPPVTFKGSNGNMYVPSKGAARSKGEKAKATGDMQTIPDQETADKLREMGFPVEKSSKSAPYGKVRAVASRPGFHATTKPVAHHLGPEDLIITSSERDQLLKAGVTPKAFKAKTFNYLDGKLISKKKVAELSPEDKKKVKSQKKYYVKRRAEDQVFVEVDMADDTSEDLLKYMQERGRTDINDKLPSGGSYTYQDGQADAETWVVGGDMKVNRVLSREEAKAAQEAAGVKDLPYRDEIEEILGRKFAKGGLIGEEDMYTGQQDSLLATGSGSILSFNEGGAVMNNRDNQMEMLFDEGGIADDGMNVDPVSGNEIPPGSMASEVRDDIPAQLSEGEYVVPADVLRFYGVKFFEDLRSEAKQGMSQMEADGRIGGEPIGMEDPRGPEGALTPEEQAEIDSMLMAVGGYVPQPMESTQPDPYMQQQAMYNTGAPKAVGNAGYAPGGVVDDGLSNNLMTDRNWADFNPWAESSQPAEQSARAVTLYGPSGEVATVTLPAQQAQYDELLALGYTETPVAVTTETAVAKDNGGGGGVRTQAKETKPYREMTPDELKKAFEDNQKAFSIMKAMAVVNPVIGLAGLGATKYADKQIRDAMEAKQLDIPETKDFFDTVLGPVKDFFSPASKFAKQTASETKSIQEGGGATGDDDGPTIIAGGGTGGGDKYVFSEDTTDYSATDDDVFDAIDAEFEAAAANPAPSKGGGGKATGGLMQKKKKKKK